MERSAGPLVTRTSSTLATVGKPTMLLRPDTIGHIATGRRVVHHVDARGLSSTPTRVTAHAVAPSATWQQLAALVA
jgi:hypothetical protein